MAQIAKRLGVLQWVVVLVVGIVVVAIVLGLNLIGRLSDGQKVLDGARPAFTSQRVAADRAGIDAISKIVNLRTRSSPRGAAGRPRCPRSWRSWPSAITSPRRRRSPC